ncbi:MBL fold metallo-hydrolase [Riemerella columbipharyngis]|uniref:Glyoxylase, beta-lactamase superfamily II n=1 Tax=Riemerella columbipharyngis TaxID=1071918 RepID=A0A1G7CHN6_9FLAO|nr:MBL fold metallo-hydrolase [Riemerella columbipharyngis]SDE38904.1 Glyoxylase, beta-lactamase superfamily II [Riemerella columbipharyngis]
MKVEQIYTKCLAQGAYYIFSEGEAAIIDPLRETQPYIEKLEQDRAKLKYIFETHFHADFVSGHLDLSEKTGASIIYGPTAQPDFEAIIAEDNQIFEIGKIKIKVLHTPGHTLESATYLLIDENGKESAIFSGDTLFLGDVGRPDLAQKATNLTQEELAGMLYDSLYNKIIPLPDDITVYPAHGAGSACGKNMQKETIDTLGNQKRTNYALNQPDKEHFVVAVLDGLTPPPKYFGMNVSMNKKGYKSFHEVIKESYRALSPEQFENLATTESIVILDTREANVFKDGFIPNSINIGLKGSFAPWVGSILVNVQTPILLVCDKDTEREAITRLSRVGFDNVWGFLEDGIQSWKEAGKDLDKINRITAEEFAEEFTPDAVVVDVRKPSEYATEHVEGAYLKPLSDFEEWVKTVDKDKPFYIHCAGGYRSMIAASILKYNGITDFKEVDGGFGQIKKTKVPTTDFVCPSKL